MSKQKAYSFLLFIATLCISLILAEIIVEHIKKPILTVEDISQYGQFNLNYGMEFKPNFLYSEYGVKYRTDSHGFYSPEISKSKKGPRIAYLGDSYSVGPGVQTEKYYPYVVSNQLKKKYKNLDYLVAAIGGQSPFPESIIFKKKVLPFNPDLVVYEEFDD